MRKLFALIMTALILALCTVGQVPTKPAAPEKKEVTQAAPPASSPTGPPQMNAADVEAFLDGLVPLQLNHDDIAGATISVVKDGKLLFVKGYGYADVAKKKPVTAPETLFRPGSISKLFTWTAVMQLFEQGKL
ncbi:MAG TPA: serine hydrolase, partial [Pyrinomonadaceae bacterium]|nr:serine hydrolase [Pyrinomonadaceae bacterium]